MLNLVVVTYPSKNLRLWPWISLYPQPRGTIRVFLQSLTRPESHRQDPPCSSRLSRVTSTFSPFHSHFQAHGWLLAGQGRERMGSRGEKASEPAEIAVCTHAGWWRRGAGRQAGAAFVHRECILLCRPYNFFFINHRSAELKRILETILLKRTPRCEERKEERRKYHLLRASHMLWIHGPRSHSQHVAELGPHST